ncbi:MAG: L-arabinose isomerase [Spirochaetales bacterium]|nr:L-arabinose isomerase [Spirochaetales bacterium]
MNATIWFAAGSQHLYGPQTLAQVEADAKKIAQALNDSGAIRLNIQYKATLTCADDITAYMRKLNADPDAVGTILWMHTFSPAKMWIQGLKELSKPFVHLHTQFNRDIPWSDIDMDYMNLHQSAHGGREFGFICTRLRKERTVIAGHWQDTQVQKRLDTWAGAALAWADSRTGKVARFGDNMRDVAVTEGDKVAAQETFGYQVHGYGVGDLIDCIQKTPDREAAAIVEECLSAYDVTPELLPGGAKHEILKDSAKIEAGLAAFLKEGGFTAFTTTFEDLHGFRQLPGLAVQRLMEKGYGFGAEGDWKTAALVRAVKVMADNRGTSFMEDYTYHLEEGNMMVLGAHMLEVCPSIAAGKPRLEAFPLSIGGKGDPARLIFTAATGPAVNASIIDLGDRFRMVVNTVTAVAPSQPLKKLPVASVLWKPDPDLKTAAAGWIYAGGAHHSAFSTGITYRELDDFCSFAGIEMVLIDGHTDLFRLRQELRVSDRAY